MNFFEATLVEADGKMFVDGGSFRMEIPGARGEAMRKNKGRQVIFGIRPEDVHTRGFEPQNIKPAELQADVDVTELMGNEIFLYLLTGKKQFVARVDPRTQAVAGDKIDLVFNMDNTHFFDPKTELALR